MFVEERKRVAPARFVRVKRCVGLWKAQMVTFRIAPAHGQICCRCLSDKLRKLQTEILYSFCSEICRNAPRRTT